MHQFRFKTHLIYSLFALSGFLSFSGFSQNAQIAPKDFYLVDSLDLNLVSEEDKKWIDSCLTVYHAASNDTMRINAVMGIVNAIWNNDVWPLYNRYIITSDCQFTSLQKQ